MSSGDLSDDERAELARLRAEVSELQAEARLDRNGDGGKTGGRGRGGRRLRRVALGVLVVLILVLTPIAVAARYARGELLDTDRYVETVAPLASKPAVQAALADRLTREAMSYLDVEDNVHKALQFLVDEGAPAVLTTLSTPIADQVADFTREHVQEFAASTTFANLWVEANRVAHDEIDALLTGRTDGSLQSSDGQITLDLGPALATLRQSLVDDGFGLASNIPDVSTQFVLLDSPELDRAQTAVRWFDRIATVLPFVVVALIALAVLVAPIRRNAVLASAAALVVGCLLLGLALIVARDWVLNSALSDTLSRDAAADITDALLHPLRTTNRAVLALGLVVAAVTLVTGPWSAARSLRSAVGQGVTSLRELALRDRKPTVVEVWMAANRNALRIAIVAAGALALVMAHYPTGGTVLAVALVVVAALVVVELVAHAASSPDSSSSVTPSPSGTPPRTA